MTTDDTSREALIERVARRIHEAADYEVPVMPWDQQTDDWRAEVSSLAAAVVDAVVMPLVQERDAAIKRAEAAEAEVERLRIQWDRSGKNDLIEQRDTWRERWRQLMRDYEAVFEERDELEAECLRVDEVNTRLGERVRQQDEVIERVRALLGEGGPWCWSELTDAFAVTLDDLRVALEGYGR